MSKFGKLNGIREQRKQTQEVPVTKSRFEQLNEIRTLLNEYRELSPWKLKNLLQEKWNDDSITPADMKAVQNLHPDPQKFVSMLPETDGDSWGALIPKSIASGALSITDLPQTGYDLGKATSNFVSDKLFKTDSAAHEKAHNNLMKGFLKKHNLNLPHVASVSDAVKKGVKYVSGIDLTPKPDTPGKRVAATAGEFVGASLNPNKIGKGVDILNKFMNAAKNPGKGIVNIMKAGATKGATKAGSIGATSGMLQEQGENPLAADIAASVAVPLALRGGKLATKGAVRGIYHFLKTPEQRLDYKVAKELRKYVPEADIPEVLANLEAGVPIINPTFAEAAKHPGISNLDRLLGRNTVGMAERHAANSELLREELAKLGELGVNSENTGSVITKALYDDFRKLKQKRIDATEPLLDDLKKYEEKVDVSDVVDYLKEKAKYTKGEIKAAYHTAVKLLTSNNNPKSILRNFDKNKNNPIPYELRTTIQAINARLKNAKSSEVKAALMDAKKAIEAKASASPGGLEYQNKHAEMSKPISDTFGERNNPNLLGDIIKKDQFNTRFELPPEKVMPKVFGASKADQRTFLSQVRNNPEALHATKDSVINQFLNTIEQGGLDAYGNPKISNIKANKWLKENNNITSNLFEPEELKRLDNIGEATTRRQMVRDVPSTVQSDSYANFSLGNQIGEAAVDGLAHTIPGGATALNIVKNSNKNPAKIQSELKKMLLDIPYGKSLLQTSIKESWHKDATKNLYSWAMPSTVANRETDRQRPVRQGEIEKKLKEIYRGE